jgi:hypothetical protein
METKQVKHNEIIAAIKRASDQPELDYILRKYPHLIMNEQAMRLIRRRRWEIIRGR